MVLLTEALTEREPVSPELEVVGDTGASADKKLGGGVSESLH